MKICIVGWYGTETIGDRAILAGIISLLKKVTNISEFYLGSLYPFFSERTLQEDSSVYKAMNGVESNIIIFDSRKKDILKDFIRKADLVLIGGGPLMDNVPLFLLDYTFTYAKEKGKKTMICGCGIGPVFLPKTKNEIKNIVNNADCIILRDSQSQKFLETFFSEKINIIKKIYVAFDPAVECVKRCIEVGLIDTSVKTREIIFNLRRFPSECSVQKNSSFIVHNKLKDLLITTSKRFLNEQILLVPMHYFFIGNDDREFLNELCLDNMDELKNVTVQNRPLSLVDTMQMFASAQIAIGMRFHSVVLQTLLNGNNFILDYTEPCRGKIAGFIEDIDAEKFYTKRYLNLQIDSVIDFNLMGTENHFKVPENYYRINREVYNKAINKVLA